MGRGRWKDSKRADTQRANTSNKGKNRFIGSRVDIEEHAIRIHWLTPPEGFLDPFSNSKAHYPWKKGIHVYVPPPVNRFIICHPQQDIIGAYSNPADYGFTDVAAISRIQKLNPRPFNAMACNVEEPHHLVEYKRENGDGTYKRRELCTGIGCEYCAQGWPTVFGRRGYHLFSNFHWNTVIMPLMEELDHYCKCGGYRYTSHYECPECKNVLINVANACPSCGPEAEINVNETTHMAECLGCGISWSMLESRNSKLDEMANPVNGLECPHCRNTVYPEAVLVCLDPNQQNCAGDPYDIFDIQMRIRRVSDSTSKSKRYTYYIDSWEITDHDPRLFDVKNQMTPQDNDTHMAERIIESFQKPVPLDDILAPTPPSEAAQLLNVRNVFAVTGFAQTNDGNEETAATTVGTAGQVTHRPAYRQR